MALKYQARILVSLAVLFAIMDTLPAMAQTYSTTSPSPESVEETLGLTRAQRVLVQRGLTALGFDVGAADGIFGPRTRAGISRWQTSRSAAATGYLDAGMAETLLKVGESAPLRSPQKKQRVSAALLAEALDFVRRFENASFRARALGAIAEAQAVAGDTHGAKRTVSEALATARRIERAGTRAWRIRNIAEAQATNGEIQGALTTARSVKDAFYRAEALSAVAEAQAVAGDTRGAKRTLSEALGSARSSKDASFRARALGAIAEAQAVAGDPRGAKRTVSEALDSTRSINNATFRAIALGTIAEAQGKRCECTTWILQLDAGSKFQGSSSWRRDCGCPAAIFSSVFLSQA